MTVGLQAKECRKHAELKKLKKQILLSSPKEELTLDFSSIRVSLNFWPSKLCDCTFVLV